VETKNESEKLFEQYLDSNGFSGKWNYEPQIQGKSKKPDYLLGYNGQKCLFEVKELREKLNEPKAYPAFIDPYTSVRKEIGEANKKFKEYKNDDYICSLVVFNIDDRQARLDPLHVLCAMVGNLGIEMNFDPTIGKADMETAKNVFGSGGKMIDYKNKQPQNTTISAIVVFEEFRDDSDIQMTIKEKIKKQNKLLTPEERFAIAHEVIIEEHHNSQSVLKVRVIENPHAKIAFPVNLFNGPFDEHWCLANGIVSRIFVGSKLSELEELKKSIEEL
jgi:hypothetical protein